MAHTVVRGIYRIRNTVNGKEYLGSSSSIRRRWYEHRVALLAGTHWNPILQAAWRKHGAAAFDMDVLEVVAVDADLFPREAYWIETRRPAYNIGAVLNGRFTHTHSPEVRERIRQARVGKKHSEETRARMSVSAKARGLSDAVRAQQKAAVTGHPRPDWVRAKISATRIRLGLGKSPARPPLPAKL